MKNPNAQPILSLRPEIMLAIRLLDELCINYQQEFVVTWTTGGTHMKGSLHPKRRAVDFLPLPQHEQVITDIAKHILGPDYDIIIENDHNHVEWDPK